MSVTNEAILEAIRDFGKRTEKLLDDHENRIRTVEVRSLLLNAKTVAIGAIALLLAAGTLPAFTEWIFKKAFGG